MKYYKILNGDMTYDGMQYHERLNINCEETIPEDTFEKGLCFSDAEYIMRYIQFPGFYATDVLIAEVEIPLNDVVYFYNHGRYKAHRIILKNIRPLWTIKTLKELKQEGVKFHTEDANILAGVAMMGTMEIFSFLVDQGYDVYKEECLALRMAATFGRLDIVQFILLNTQEQNQEYLERAFSAALINGHCEIVNYFLKKRLIDTQSNFFLSQKNIIIHCCPLYTLESLLKDKIISQKDFLDSLYERGCLTQKSILNYLYENNLKDVMKFLYEKGFRIEKEI